MLVPVINEHILVIAFSKPPGIWKDIIIIPVLEAGFQSHRGYQK